MLSAFRGITPVPSPLIYEGGESGPQRRHDPLQLRAPLSRLVNDLSATPNNQQPISNLRCTALPCNLDHLLLSKLPSQIDIVRPSTKKLEHESSARGYRWWPSPSAKQTQDVRS